MKFEIQEKGSNEKRIVEIENEDSDYVYDSYDLDNVYWAYFMVDWLLTDGGCISARALFD